jgi:hypothetical protein
MKNSEDQFIYTTDKGLLQATSLIRKRSRSVGASGHFTVPSGLLNHGMKWGYDDIFRMILDTQNDQLIIKRIGISEEQKETTPSSEEEG